MKYINNKKYDRKSLFKAEEFNMPPAEFSPVYTWAWGSPVTKKGIKQRIDDLCSINVRSFYILPMPKGFRPNSCPTNMEPDYLTPEYFEMYKYVLDYAAEKGMKVWLYDEGGWPSGSATGKVVEKRHDLLNSFIVKKEVASPYTPGKNAIAAFCDGKRIEGGFASDKPIYEYTRESWTDKFTPPYPNMINPETTETFLELTHNKYKEYIDGHFGDTMQIAFTDEPSAMGRPWCRELSEAFVNKYGYSLEDFLPAIMGDDTDTDRKRQAKMDYHNLVAELLSKNYLEKIRDWCNENNLLSTGHMGGEDETINNERHGYHHIMRQLRSFDIPGVDTIWRQIFPGQKNHFFPRFASSAADQIGSPYVLSESFAIYGAGITFDQMRYVTLYQLVRGVNIMNIMGYAYDHTGHGMGGARPMFVKEMPTWGQLYDYNSFSARMTYLMSIGRSATGTALYMPMNDIWAGGEYAEKICKDFDDTAYTLEKMHSQFDIIDDDFLETAELCGGKLASGVAAYDTVVIPPCKYIPDESKAVLDSFIAQGGKVLACNELDKVTPVAKISCDEVTVRKKILDNGIIYLLCNEAADTKAFSVSFDDKGNIYELDAQKGIVYKADTTDNITLMSGEGRVYFITDEVINARDKDVEGEILAQPAGFEMAKNRSFVIGENRFESQVFYDEYEKAEPGDWRKTYGDDFSGIVSYKTSFKLKKIPRKVLIDLGRVNYSCDGASINGTELGPRAMSPFVYEVDGKLLKEENEFIVNIANTCGNQYSTTKVFDKYPYEIIGPYHAKELVFEGDFVESGLMGPVTIKEVK